MIKCSKCNTKNTTEAKFCENCGNVLAIAKQTKETKIELNYCPNCGNGIEKDSSFCSDCGTAFGEQCPKCNALNQADAKFCENCAQPLNWVCVLCNNKNSVGSIYCENCGSNGIIKKPLYAKPVFWSIAASVIILLTFSYYQYNKLDTQIKFAIKNAENNKFDIAFQNIEKANNILLPFKNEKLKATKKLITEKQTNYKKAIQEEQERITKQQNSKKHNQQYSNSNNNSNTNYQQESYVKSVTVYFTTTYSCLIKQNLRVSRQGYDISTETRGFGDPSAFIYPWSGSANIKGNYSYSWSFYSQCINYGKPDGPYTFSGTFYLDGKHSSYNIFIGSSGYPSITGL